MNTRRRAHSRVEKVSGKLAVEIRRRGFGIEGRLPPERQLAERYGVSRPVVREAIRQLQSQGLLEVRHGVGVRVIDQLHRPLSFSLCLRLPDAPERIRQLIEMRLLIEPAVARLAAARATSAHLLCLRAVQEKLRNSPDTTTAVECDLAFHRELALASGNEVLALILESAADLGRESRKLTISRYGPQRAYEEHETILAAVASHKPDEAEAAMRQNLVVTADVLDNALAIAQLPVQRPPAVRRPSKR